MRYVWFVFFLCARVGLAQSVDDLLKSAELSEQRGETEGAIEILQRAARLDPQNAEIEKRLAREYTRRIEDVQDPSTRRNLGQLSVDLGEKAVQKLPDDAAAHFGLAAAYGELCQVVDGKTRIEFSKRVYSEANKGLALDPKSHFGHLVLARWNFEMSSINPLLRGMASAIYGQFPPASKDEALAQFAKAVELAPDSIMDHAEYAKVLDALGERSRSREQWLKVIELKPIGAQERRYRSMAEDMLKRG